MESFSNQIFPEDISYKSSCGPEFNTDVIISKNGREQRACNWHKPKFRYNVAYGVRTQDQLDKLVSFFINHKGKAIGFCFKDWTDYKALNQNLSKIDDLNYQLIKNYNHDIRFIKKPLANSLKLTLNGKAFKDFKLDEQKGIVKLKKEINSDLKASFEFYVPVRFDTDRLSSSLDSYGVYSLIDIPLVEIM